MKILLGADTYPPDSNGAARFTQRLARGLRERGHEVHVVCPSWDGPPGEEIRDGATVHRMRSRRWPLHEQFRVCLPWEVANPIARVVERVAPDVVHAQAHFVVGRYLVQAAAAQARPLVATNHVMPENLLDQARIPRALQRRVSAWAWADLARTFRHAQIVTAPTPRAVDLLHERTPLRGAVPVSCGIDPLPYAQAARQAEADALSCRRRPRISLCPNASRRSSSSSGSTPRSGSASSSTRSRPCPRSCRRGSSSSATARCARPGAPRSSASASRTGSPSPASSTRPSCSPPTRRATSSSCPASPSCRAS